MTGLDWYKIAQSSAEERQAALAEVINEHFAALDNPEDLPARDLYLWAFCDGWETSGEAFLDIQRQAFGK